MSGPSGRPHRGLYVAVLAAAMPALAAAQSPTAEAPDLAAAVAAGTLPDLASRMPAAPLVITPLDSVGTYGGTWRSAVRGTGDSTWIRRTIGYDSLVRWDPTFSTIIPNLAASFEASPDAMTYTFALREGVRWSDGTPFTAADITFWYTSVLQNDEIDEGIPSWLETSEGDCAVTADGDYTVIFACPTANGLLLENLAGPRGEQVVSWPAHYLKPFHPDHATEADLAAAVTAEGAETWVELFLKKADWDGNPIFQNVDKPTLNAWTVVQPYSGTQVSFERNPYYWKIDTAGNQLPYIDRVVYEIVQDNEVLLLKGLNGELDFHARHFNTVANRSILSESAEAGGYRLIDMPTTDTNYVAISLNLTHADEAKRALYANKDFRIGLSHAIDRAEIIDLVFLGAGEPWQVAPLPDSAVYNETLATQFTVFDPALANEHLDRAGLTTRDAAGLRLGPDGQPVRVRITVRNDLDEVIEALELVKGHWAEVGITLDLDVVERSLFRTRTRANEHDAAADNAEGGGKDFFLLADNWFPSDPASYWGYGWYQWFDGETEGGALEPSDTVKRVHALWYEATSTLDPAARTAKATELLDTVAGEFWQIGIARPTEGYGIAKTNLANVAPLIIDSFAMGAPGPARSEQFYFAN
jgi:peptide/nickel transport system substrate-binding protein